MRSVIGADTLLRLEVFRDTLFRNVVTNPVTATPGLGLRRGLLNPATSASEALIETEEVTVAMQRNAAALIRFVMEV